MSRIPTPESRRRSAEVSQSDRGILFFIISLGRNCIPDDSANKLLTPAQRRMVIGMGFGAMLNFQIIGTPLRLGNWLLSNMDLHSMTLRLLNGVAIEVDEEVVEAVLIIVNAP
nr:phospholipase-like protein [Ipomoea batatas]GME09504.1 phospholipase-like protein [Ipomoea batatas]